MSRPDKAQAELPWSRRTKLSCRVQARCLTHAAHAYSWIRPASPDYFPNITVRAEEHGCRTACFRLGTVR
jgi:hypothetical protein